MEPREIVHPDSRLVAKKFKKIIKTFTTVLDNYIKNPDEDNIHDIRIAIRRMEAVYRILPKKIRQERDLQKYVEQSKNLFKINTRVRDFDIICSKLEKKQPNQFSQIISSINNKRKIQLSTGIELALKIKDLTEPRLKEKEIGESRLRKRFQKVVTRLANEINQNIPVVLGDEKKVEEIHKLRKDFKKLRYSIELTSEKRDSLESIKSLKRIQDELGLIHDSDIFLDYLREIEGPHDLSGTIREEILERKERYNKFVQVFRVEKIDPRKLIS
ncbi:MAG TPA: CHAD domain-containing protein [Candidatus Nitrosotalea sp.]|nr:CHAD domain-containing protein [Candidatus Nitrosotalea sp.]